MLRASASARPRLWGPPCPRAEGGDEASTPALARSLGNLFPGPSRPSKPWPAQPRRCWLRFPHFLVFSSPPPQRSCSPAQPPPARAGTGSQRGGVLEKGPGRGCREAAPAAAPGGGGHRGVTSSPELEWGSAPPAQPFPAQPAPGAGSQPIKTGTTHLPGCSPTLSPGLFCCCPLYQECSSQTSVPV